MRNQRQVVFILLSLMLSLSACNFPHPTASPSVVTQGNVQTIAALTVQALLATTPPSATVKVPQPTLTFTSTGTTIPSQPSQPSATQGTPEPTGTATPKPTPCDRATFIDETVPDDTEISPEGSFIKTWTLKNNGTCTWNSGYSLVFVKGEAMTSVASTQITTGSVAPGDTITVGVTLKAPTADGTYRGDWELRNGNGALFGLGADATSVFWVQIKVVGSKAGYFIDNMCAAQWISGAGALPCTGKTSDKKGFVIRQDAPKLQNGQVDNEPALWTNPQPESNGFIVAKYPAVTIAAGQHFKSVLGCLFDAKNCNVKFSLIAAADGGADQTLQEWSFNYTSPITPVDIDLSSLAGKSVVFTLKVTVITGPDQAQAYWLKPRLEP